MIRSPKREELIPGAEIRLVGRAGRRGRVIAVVEHIHYGLQVEFHDCYGGGTRIVPFAKVRIEVKRRKKHAVSSDEVSLQFDPSNISSSSSPSAASSGLRTAKPASVRSRKSKSQV